VRLDIAFISNEEHLVLFQYKTIIESINRDLVHHFTTYQCDSDVHFDDARLPNEVCDEIVDELKSCNMNVVAAWAIGGDDVRLSLRERDV
jgi:Copper type II ascorbate-dependent monooxygenase, N-terminal domain